MKFVTTNKQKVKHRILHLLKTGGPQAASALAEQLQITPMAIRQHLQALQSDQLVTYEEERQPVGRPIKLWQLTTQGNQLFPDTHADLVVKLIAGVRKVYGEQGIDALLSERTQSQIVAYSAELKEEINWKQRVAAIAKIRSLEGYMAEVVERADNKLLLVENHCSIEKAAQSCSQFCRSEWAVFKALLGPEVSIERVEHIINGDRRCAYLISSHET